MRKDRLLIALVVLAPIIFCLYLVYVAPRPYYVTEMDIEQDYYYNAQLLNSRMPVYGIHHPGTHIYYLGYLLLKLSGDTLEGAQRFFNLSYVVIAVSTALSLYVFARLVLVAVPVGISIVALASVLAWPPFLTYLNFFGSDAFIVAVGLPTIACFWSSLVGSPVNKRKKAFICGAGLGACLATKVSFAPVVLAVCVGIACHLILSDSPCGRGETHTHAYCRIARAFRQILPTFLGLVGSFLTLTAPVFTRLGDLVLLTASRTDAFPEDHNWLAGSYKTLGLLAEANVWYVGLLLVGLTCFLLALIVVILNPSIKGEKLRGDSSALAGDRFDYVSGGIFIGLMLIALLYTGNAAVNITPGAEPGVRLRNMSPTLLFLPFMILYSYKVGRNLFKPVESAWRFFQPALVVTALAILAFGVTTHLVNRKRLIETHLARIAETNEKLASLALSGTRTAFWTESAQDFLGEVSFHYWGNYRYTEDYFDRKVTDSYSTYALFRLRSIGLIFEENLAANHNPKSEEASLPLSKYGKAGEIYWKMRRWLLSRRRFVRKSGVVTGEQFGVEVSAIAYPEDQLVELRSMPEQQLFELIANRFGPFKVWREQIGDVRWVLILLSSPVAIAPR